MRIRTAVLPALLLASALVLGACSSDGADGSSASPTAAASATIEVGDDGPFPKASGSFGDKPELGFPAGEPSTGLQAKVLEKGDGDTVESGDLIVVNYLGQVWGGEVFDNSYDRGNPAAFQVGVGSVIRGWDAGLVGQPIGSRVLLSIPPEFGYGAEGNSGAGIGGTDTLVFVVDIIDTYDAKDAGSPDATVTKEAAGVRLDITGELGEPVKVAIPEGAAEPTEVRTTVLARAAGKPVAAGDVVVHYAAAVWDNSTSLSTWEYGSPQVMTLGGGSQFDVLLGVPVGSRVLLEFPAEGEDSPAMAVVMDVVAQISTAG